MLSFERRGSGAPVVLLHGVGTSSWMWNPVVEHLTSRDVVLIDLPGHGASNKIPWISLKDSAARVVEVLDHLELRQVTLVGLSLGAYVALEALAASPGHFKGAVVSGVHSGGMPMQWAMVAMATLTAPFVGLPSFSARTARMLAGPGADIEAFQREAAKTRRAAFRRASIDATRFELPTQLSLFQGPLMVCCGSEEHPLIQTSVETIAAAVSQGHTFIADGGGHGWPVVQAEQFASLVLES